MRRMFLPGARLLVVLVMLLAALPGCTRGLECFGVDRDECHGVVDAARERLPFGHTRVVVEAGRGFPTPYSVFACYPDGSQVVLEVTMTRDGPDVRPLEGVELASCN